MPKPTKAPTPPRVQFKRHSAAPVFAERYGNSLQLNPGLLRPAADIAPVLAKAAELRRDFEAQLETARAEFKQSPIFTEYVVLRDKWAEVAQLARSEAQQAEEQAASAMTAVRAVEDPREAQEKADQHRTEAARLERWANELKAVVEEARSKAQAELLGVMRQAYASCRAKARDQESAAIERLLCFDPSDLALALFADTLAGVKMEDAISFYVSL